MFYGLLQVFQRFVRLAQRRKIACGVVKNDRVIGGGFDSAIQPALRPFDVPQHNKRTGAQMKCPRIVRVPLNVILNDSDRILRLCNGFFAPAFTAQYLYPQTA